MRFLLLGWVARLYFGVWVEVGEFLSCRIQGDARSGERVIAGGVEYLPSPNTGLIERAMIADDSNRVDL